MTPVRIPSIATRCLLVFAAASGVSACSKPAGEEAPSAAASTRATATAAPPATIKVAAPLDAASKAATAAPASTAASKGATPGTWAGNYTSAKGALYVPVGTDVPNSKDWSGVKWRGDEDTKGLGDGAVKLDVDAAGQVHGTVEGPLGGGVVTGVLDDRVLRASVRPKAEGADSPFYGTILGTVEGTTLDGTMKLSSPTGNLLRSATFKLTRS